MRALSLHQPWATAWLIGSKLNETRHWPANYRGQLAIHAAKKRVVSELLDYASDPAWIAALTAAGWTGKPSDIDLLPYGSIIGVVDLISCVPTKLIRSDFLDSPRRIDGVAGQWFERDMGNYADGRFAFEATNRRALPKPIPYPGRQKWFSIPDEVIAAAFREPR